ncbi:DUF4215 domain-containing protein [Polyangium mundeleinium]|uniref:DUF4215 domain-containing protein n=1 Tax=Polyangium mundeleinium TaxID=2995306 RepID=A0ABT5F1V3_9BACT|nr:DUF4215 domain-containing protein [Polyangium mundeleinium]MDC0747408.1 DUF4215 domain-containing protein [Polyangium mundeleinium]
MFSWLLGAWAACNQVAGIREGKPYPDACVTVADCVVPAPECRAAACIDERCVYDDEPAGTPLATQTVGDCLEAQCDGGGRIRLLPVEADFADDGNPCTFDHCVGSTPTHERLSFAPCYGGPAGARGIGICVEGKQACNEDAVPTGPCLGEVLPREETCLSIFDEDCDGLVNESGVGCVCVPGAIGDCFGGPEAALGNTPCQSGKQICNPDGTAYGECVGQTLPSPETCSSSSVDDDCDGWVDEEGPGCVCGDGVLSNAEVCDDGNTDDTDECTTMCKVPSCGDGVVQPGEACDDGNGLDSDACTAACVQATCGDGLLRVGVEECDDGNTIDTDTCTSACKNAICGDGFVRKGVEECDDGSPTATETCLPDCLVAPVELFAGGVTMCVLFADGRAKCWGANDVGQLGLGNTLSRGDAPNEMGDALPFLTVGQGRRLTSMALGTAHTCGLLDDETVKCWGGATVGQVGLGDAGIRGDGPGEMGDALPILDLGAGRTAKAISCGYAHSCAILDDDSLKCWGYNANGQLGQGDTMDRGNMPGQMGDDLPPISLGTGRSARQPASGHSFQCAVLDDDTVKCWGYNDWGQLGQGDTTERGDGMGEMGDALPVAALGNVGQVLSLATTFGHSCALLSGGKVKCWGLGDVGQLGLGDGASRGDGPGELGDNLPFVDLGTGKTATHIVTGAASSCAILNDGTVKCWGENARGQLGLGDKVDRGNGPGQMGDALPTVDLGTGRKARKIAMGGRFACVLLDDASVKCWGQNNRGQLGLGDILDRGDEPNEMGDNLLAVKLR